MGTDTISQLPVAIAVSANTDYLELSQATGNPSSPYVSKRILASQLIVNGSGGGGSSTNISATETSNSVSIASSTGTGTTIPAATAYLAGVLDSARAAKIDGLATIATSGSAHDLVAGTVPSARMPTPGAASLGGIKAATAPANQFQTGVDTSGNPTFAQPSFSNIAASVSPSQLPTPTASTLGGVLSAIAGTGTVQTGIDASGNPVFSGLPTPTASTLGGVESFTAPSHQWVNSISLSGVPSSAQPAFTDISGSVAAAQLPNPTASTLGGVQSLAAVTHKYINAISTSGVPSAAQPVTADLADGAPILGITRAQIASYNLSPFTRFVTTNGAAWVQGNSSGPMAIQDAAARWWNIDLSGSGKTASILWFGGVGDGSTDNLAAFNAAIAAGVKTLYIPTGTFKITGNVACGTSALKLVGDGAGNSIISATSGTFDMFSWATSGFDGGCIGIKFLSTGMTGGNILSIKNQQRFTIRDCVFGNGYNHIYIEDQNVLTITDCVSSGAGGAYAIRNLGTALGNANVLNLHNLEIGFATNTSSSPVGIIIDGAVNTINITHTAVTKGYRGLSVVNTVGLSTSTTLFISAFNFQSDYPYDSAIYLTGGASGTTGQHQFVACYAHASQSSDNIYVDTSARDVKFIGLESTGGYKRAVNMLGKYIYVLSGAQIAANSQAGSASYPGIELGASSVGCHVHDSLVGLWSGFQTEKQSYGVVTDVGATYYNITGNNFHGNVTGAVQDNAAHGASVIANNITA
jgi:hypothetical protein